MPALQVRDFPDELYERLKVYASQEHRSMAQQTIVAVQEMLRGTQQPIVQPAETGRIIHFDSPADRQARIEKRKAALAAFADITWKGPKPTAESITQLIRGGREERGQQICANLDLAAEGR